MESPLQQMFPIREPAVGVEEAVSKDPADVDAVRNEDEVQAVVGAVLQ